MKIGKFKNILFSLFNRERSSVIMQKILIRVLESESNNKKRKYLKWLETNKSNLDEFCISLDRGMWALATERAKLIDDGALKVLDNISHDLGGGGSSELILFICLYIKPDIVVETGVAAGFSTYSILEALRINKRGHLYSSDFPYFRISNPEKYIGIIVPENLKKRWDLYIKGDKKNLDEIKTKIKKIDFFHYDSDKSFFGRNRSLRQLKNMINENTWLLFDDIQDNSHFKFFVEKSYKNWKIFSYKNKWIGLVYPK